MFEQELTPAQLLDAAIHHNRLYKQSWKVATVTTDYGSVIDFTELGIGEAEMLLADPTFIASIVEKTFSQHPCGVFLPCKRQRDWTDHEAERLTIWKINKDIEKKMRKDALQNVYSVGGKAG
jgi:hypothetical protein